MSVKTSKFILVGCLGLVLSGCFGNMASNSNEASSLNGGGNPYSVPFVPFAPDIYVQRIKSLMTGDVTTPDEVSSVVASPSSLSNLVAQWEKTPAFQEKIRLFLATALQQTNVIFADTDAQGAYIGDLNNGFNNLLLGNMREMMARTVMQLDSQSQPFKTTMTTRSFMMTPPLMAYYAYLDAIQKTDTGRYTNNNPNGQLQSVFGGFVASDFDAWKMVTIRQPNGGEGTTAAADTPTLKSATTLVLKTPRIGFWTTPTFFAGWQTNPSNQARVTMNQALIVALGHAFDGTLTGMPQSLAALDSSHAKPQTACYGCHINLDPARQYYRQAYSIYFSPQTDPNQMATPGQFAFDGVNVSGGDLASLADQWASHPDMAPAWVGKVCSWANDMTCLPSDPEVIRLGQSFANHGSFSTMVREVLTSPLSTWASPTSTTTANGISLSIAKSDHLCPLLATRLGVTDPCGVAANANPQGDYSVIQTIASSLPANNYARGQVAAVQALDPSLFYRSAAENICARLANQMVDGDAKNAQFASADPNSAIDHLVSDLMGIKSAQAQTPHDLLREHFNAALTSSSSGSSVSATDAMRSTFVVACLSPAVMGSGMGL